MWTTEEHSVSGKYDVFLSHSPKDKAVVRSLAERLRADGLKVWFDEWGLKPGDSIPAKIEAALEHSHVLVLPTLPCHHNIHSMHMEKTLL